MKKTITEEVTVCDFCNERQPLKCVFCGRDVCHRCGGIGVGKNKILMRGWVCPICPECQNSDKMYSVKGFIDALLAKCECYEKKNGGCET